MSLPTPYSLLPNFTLCSTRAAATCAPGSIPARFIASRLQTATNRRPSQKYFDRRAGNRRLKAHYWVRAKREGSRNLN
jgi:hypothetical protein